MNRGAPAIVVACDSFKGTLSSAEANAAVATAASTAMPGAKIRCIEVADGGEGTLAAVRAARGGELVHERVEGPLGEAVDGAWLLLDDGCALIESAAALGLTLVEPAVRNPLSASSAGLGQLILSALGRGARRIMVALGGTATVDGGAGMLRILGARLLDADGCELAGRGGDLARIAVLDLSGLDPRLSGVELSALVDVSNPLCGEDGAAHVFGPQKGAGPAAVEELEDGMVRWAGLIDAAGAGRVSDLAGAGAAGGIAAALAILGAELVSGSEALLGLCGLPEALDGARLCVTGEGRLDAQTPSGKLVSGVVRACADAGVPCAAVAGAIDRDFDPSALGLCAWEACMDEAGDHSVDGLRAGAAGRLERAAERLFRRL